MSTSVGLVWHCQFLRGTHFIHPSELEANNSPKNFDLVYILLFYGYAKDS